MSEPTFPYALERVGVLMRPDRDDPFEAEGVLNPAAAWSPDGRLVMLPRVVAAGNRSRIATGEVVVRDGVPVDFVRGGIALGPDRSWEHGSDHGGVEDPRITWIESLGVYVMTYVAFGPLGPRGAIALSDDLRTWRRLGPIQFTYHDELDTDLNLYPNKDLLWFPEPIPGPDGEPCYGFLHRPMWEIRGQTVTLPAGLTDRRAAIWLSYVRVADVHSDITALLRPFGHRLVAGSEFDWEVLKIGGGPPPMRVPEGWLLLHHGVSGTMTDNSFEPQKDVYYAAGAMILSADDPSRVVARTREPLMSPQTADETSGIVANVVFPTAIVDVDGTDYVFYGMADMAIGVARLVRR